MEHNQGIKIMLSYAAMFEYLEQPRVMLLFVDGPIIVIFVWTGCCMVSTIGINK